MCAPPARSRSLEARQQRSRAPDAAEVVDAHHLLDQVEIGHEERARGRACPALLTSRWTAGCRSSTRAARASTAARSPTSHSSTSPPISSASARSRSSRRATSTQCQPLSASSARGRLADARRRSGDDGDALHGVNVTQISPPVTRLSLSPGFDPAVRERVAPGALPGAPIRDALPLGDRPALEPRGRAEVEHDMTRPEIGAADDPGRRTRVARAAEDGVGELLVLEAALGALREPVRPAPGQARREMAPVALGQWTGVVVRARRERRAVAGDHCVTDGEHAPVAGGRPRLDDHERVGRQRPGVVGRSRGARPARARRSRRRRARDPLALRRRPRRTPSTAPAAAPAARARRAPSRPAPSPAPPRRARPSRSRARPRRRPTQRCRGRRRDRAPMPAPTPAGRAGSAGIPRRRPRTSRVRGSRGRPRRLPWCAPRAQQRSRPRDSSPRGPGRRLRACGKGSLRLSSSIPICSGPGSVTSRSWRRKLAGRLPGIERRHAKMCERRCLTADERQPVHLRRCQHETVGHR